MSSSTASKVTVAVAGVTSGLGHSIASALLSLPYSESVSVTLLTRQAAEPNPLLKPLVAAGAIVKEVDYTSIDSITSALQGIHTVISTVHGIRDSIASWNVIDGAQAAGVKRFAPSEFTWNIEKAHKIAYYASKVSVWEKLQKSGMEYTAFCTGLFMDYLVFGSPVPYEGPLRIVPLFVDVSQRKASIPGTGNEPITLIMIEDIGKFVASACVDPSPWPVELGMSGETTTYNRVVQEVEAVLGKKVDVTYISKEVLETELVANNADGNVFGAFLVELQLNMLEAGGEIPVTILNEKFGEVVKPMKVVDVLKKYWGKK